MRKSSSVHQSYFRCAKVVVPVLALALGCDPTVPALPDTPPSISVRDFVSGIASADLDEHGRFQSAGQNRPGSNGISPVRAKAIAETYAQRFGPGLRGPLIREHGGPIDFSALHAAGRVYLADTPYGVPPDSIAPGLKKRYGPYYLVHLFEGGKPAVAAAVSYASEQFREDENGAIRFFEMVGNDVLLHGLDQNQPPNYPITPEEAVAISYWSTGLKAIDVPTLLLEPAPMSPFSARWQITLEQPLEIVANDGQSYVTSNVYVGFKRQLTVGVRDRLQASLQVKDNHGLPQLRAGVPASYLGIKSIRKVSP